VAVIDFFPKTITGAVLQVAVMDTVVLDLLPINLALPLHTIIYRLHLSVTSNPNL
jgi:hypothetical protein